MIPSFPSILSRRVLVGVLPQLVMAVLEANRINCNLLFSVASPVDSLGLVHKAIVVLSELFIPPLVCVRLTIPPILLCIPNSLL